MKAENKPGDECNKAAGVYATNLCDLLNRVKTVESAGVTFIEGQNKEEFISYKDLYNDALETLAFIQNAGIKQNDELVFQIESNKDFLSVFWACILGGVIPIPLNIGHNDDHKLKIFNVWEVLKNPYLIISKSDLMKLEDFAFRKGLIKIYTKIKNKIIINNEVHLSKEKGKIVTIKEDDIAFIQFSSGSTGAPKGVVLTHKNLIKNIEAITTASNYTEEDIMLSWMPLTHDMGLIGFHLNPLYCGMNQYLMPTALFVRRPTLWLEKTSKYKVTIIGSPNFGYQHFLKHLDNTLTCDWDLSKVRIIYNGAEPISKKICNSFLNRLLPFGLTPLSMCPVYGLAEASLAVTISKQDSKFYSLNLSRDSLFIGERIRIVGENVESVSFVNVGEPIKHCQIRIVNSNSEILPDETIGLIQINGENVTMSYYQNEYETRKNIDTEGWLMTGDIGFIVNNSLYVTGRVKDIIFTNGQNLYAHDIERIAEEVEGIELNKIVVSSFINHITEKQEIVAFVFHRGTLESFIDIVRMLKTTIGFKLNIEFDHVIPVKDIPRTTSGKLQRYKLLEYFMSGIYSDIETEIDKLLSNINDSEEIKLTNNTEIKLIEIWRKIFDRHQISITDNFFYMGGNSLKAAEMQMLILRDFDKKISIKQIYEFQNVRNLAKELSSIRKEKYFSIKMGNYSDTYPVSSAQMPLYYFWQANKQSTCYNVPFAFDISGELDVERLENCLNQLINRHDALRMSFIFQNEPLFMIHSDVSLKINSITSDESDLNEQLIKLIKPFDLEVPILFRVALIKVYVTKYTTSVNEVNTKFVLFIDAHHIIIDGLSINILIKELVNLYTGNSLPKLDIQYKDFAQWEKLNLIDNNNQREFWLAHLDGELPALNNIFDYKRPLIFSNKGSKVSFELTSDITKKIKHLAKANQCTPHIVLLTIYNILLAKYTGQDDLIIGVPVVARNHSELHNLVGMFVNNLAIRNKIQWEEMFTDLLDRVNRNFIEALDNQNYSFIDLIGAINQQRDVSRNPIFDTVFTYRDWEPQVIKSNDISLKRVLIDPGIAKYDISLEISDFGEKINYSFEYCTSLFKKETILQLAGHFKILIESVIKSPKEVIKKIQMISAEEFKKYIYKVNATQKQYDLNKTIKDLFEEQVRLNPQNIAIEYNDESISYYQLASRVNSLAEKLKSKGVVQNEIVGIILKRSPELLLSIMAILKVGACFVPISDNLPLDRVKLIISNSKCRYLISTSLQYETIINSLNNETFDTDKQEPFKLEIFALNNKGLYQSDTTIDAAYILYTSGTTGQPKGVVVGQQSLVNYISWAAKVYLEEKNVAFPLFTSISFDLTFTSIFLPLVTGNKIVIYQEFGDEILLERVIKDNKVDVIKLTPSHLKIINEPSIIKLISDSKLKVLIVGGEEFKTELAQKTYEQFKSKIDIYNEYGPTETTVGCMIYKYEPGQSFQSVPIGVPAQNTQIYLLDKNILPVPAAVQGEIFISGDGVAKGYLYDESLTRQKFIPNPFILGKTMYRTGDLAKRHIDGTIEFIGRLDNQIKYNGYRIELSEIEDCLLKYDGIVEVLVVLQNNNDNHQRICAFYQATSNIFESALRTYLNNALPTYMIPKYLVQVDKIKLTQNGKIDYRFYQEYKVSNINKTLSLPNNDLERMLVQIWEEVLSEEKISTRDNFFELGGDSIKALQIKSRLFERGISLEVKDILTYRTIEQISLLSNISEIEQCYNQNLVEGEKEMSPIEKWFFDKKFINPNLYNQSILLKVNSVINKSLLEDAFSVLISHHDGLRLNYNKNREILYYNNRHLGNNFIIEEYQISTSVPNRLEQVCQQIKEGFDLTSSLLLKAILIKDFNSAEFLFITAHHILMDGVSWRILLEDLKTLYTGFVNGKSNKLVSKTASLSEWVKALKNVFTDEYLTIEQKYWYDIDNYSFEVPLDNKSSGWMVMDLCKMIRVLDEKRTKFLLKEAHRAYKTDVPIILNTVLALTLKKWTGDRKFIIEQENHGRHIPNIDVSRTIGWFTALYPLAISLTDESVGNQIKEIKELLKNVPNNGIGYGVYKNLNSRFNLVESKMSEIRLNYLGQFNEEFTNEMFSFSSLQTGGEVDPHNKMTTKLELNAMIIEGVFKLEISYNKKAHTNLTIQWFINEFFCQLDHVLNHLESETELHYTPSDFSFADLDQNELDSLF